MASEIFGSPNLHFRPGGILHWMQAKSWIGSRAPQALQGNTGKGAGASFVS